VIRNAIEDALSKFYDITSEDIENLRKSSGLSQDDTTCRQEACAEKPNGESEKSSKTAASAATAGQKRTVNKDSPKKSISSVITPSSTSIRQNAVQSFLQDIPSASTAFTKSPAKPPVS